MSSSDLRGSIATPPQLESGKKREGMLERKRSEEEWWFISRKTDEPISAEKITLKERYVFESRHRTTHTIMKVSGLR